jgi:ABC-type multidrug transport system ATPase subunit
MLALREIAKSYARLERISLEVALGQVVLLVGRNGAGKTTLLRIATGYLDPDAGEVTVAGEAMPRAQRHLGYLPEHAPSPVELTPREHLRLRARLKRAKPDDVDRVLAAVSITGAEVDRPIGLLSKGFRQRVGLADALLGAPQLLVLDEPTSGMDPIQTRQLVAHLADAARRCAVLVSSHAVGDLASLATRVIVLHDGTLRPVDAGAGGYRETLEAKVLEMLGGT